MWVIFGTLFGQIGARLVSAFGNLVLAPALNTVQNGQNANRDVAAQSLQAEIAADQARAAIALASQGADLLHWPAGSSALRCDLPG